MEFTSKCKKCDGTGEQKVTISDFVEAAYDARLDNTINAIRTVRQLASDYRLPSGLKECKLFVEALQDFESETYALSFVNAIHEFERHLRGGESRAYPTTR